MKKVILTVFILVSFALIIQAQPVPLIGTSTHSFYLSSDLKLGIFLKYSNLGEEEQYLPRLTGYSLNENLTIDSNGNKCLKLNFYKIGHIPPKDSIMNINLYFDEMPKGKMINFYLNVPAFVPGHRTVNVNLDEVKKMNVVWIDYQSNKAVQINQSVIDQSEQSIAFNITRIVFPGTLNKK